MVSADCPRMASDYENLRDALGKLQLNDAALFYRAGKISRARVRLPRRLSRIDAHGDCAASGWAGIRHQLVTTAPSVEYRINETRHSVEVDSLPKFPPPERNGKIKSRSHAIDHPAEDFGGRHPELAKKKGRAEKL